MGTTDVFVRKIGEQLFGLWRFIEYHRRAEMQHRKDPAAAREENEPDDEQIAVRCIQFGVFCVQICPRTDMNVLDGNLLWRPRGAGRFDDQQCALAVKFVLRIRVERRRIRIQPAHLVHVQKFAEKPIFKPSTPLSSAAR